MLTSGDNFALMSQLENWSELETLNSNLLFQILFIEVQHNGSCIGYW